MILYMYCSFKKLNMKYTEITLTKDTREEIQKRLEAIVSVGMYTFGRLLHKDPIKTNATFGKFAYWKESKVVACEEKNDWAREFFPDIPEKTCLLKITHPDCPFGEGRKDHPLMENDIFYFYKKTVRIRPQDQTFEKEFQLFEMKFLCKPPYNTSVLKGWAVSNKVREDMFFDEASVENEFA